MRDKTIIDIFSLYLAEANKTYLPYENDIRLFKTFLESDTLSIKDAIIMGITPKIIRHTILVLEDTCKTLQYNYESNIELSMHDKEKIYSMINDLIKIINIIYEVLEYIEEELVDAYIKEDK